MLSFSARTERLNEFEEILRPFGIAEIQRTGRVALPSLD
jgi:acetolactate synthase small subunit